MKVPRIRAPHWCRLCLLPIRYGPGRKDSAIFGPPSRGLEDPPYAQRFGNSPCLGDTAPRAEWSIAVRDLAQRPKAVCLNLFRKRFKET